MTYNLCKVSKISTARLFISLSYFSPGTISQEVRKSQLLNSINVPYSCPPTSLLFPYSALLRSCSWKALNEGILSRSILKSPSESIFFRTFFYFLQQIELLFTCARSQRFRQRGFSFLSDISHRAQFAQ